MESMDYVIDISSGSDEEVQDDELIRQQDGTVITDEKLIYQAALQDLNQPKTEKDLPLGVLTVPLMRHQKIALEWMRKKEKRSSKNCLGGIVADDQGLGKTISTIALILLQKLKSQSKRKQRRRSRRAGGTLVVCPASVVKQWANEINDKVSDEYKLSVLVYHGNNRIRSPTQLAKYDVVVTTYSLVKNEVPHNPLLDYYDRKRVSASVMGPSGPLAKVKWMRVVLDEAQTIKNYRTQVARACSSLRAKKRWCLSGTPIQNEIMDLYSYFKFLRYHPYAMQEAFYKKISCPISKSSVRGYKKLQAILRAIMLRRTKGTILDGQPIINLPPKIVNLSKVDFSLEEFSFYRKLEAYAQDQFQAYAAEGTVYQNYASILVMLLRLRQACDHPNLVKLAFSCEFWKEPLRKIPRESLYNLLSLLDTSSTICCSVCKDQPKERLIALCGHMFCYDCATEHMNGDQACPVPECGGNLGLDSVFSESILISFFEDDDDYYVDQKPLALRKSKFTSTKIKAVMEVLELLPKQGSPNSLPIKTIVFSQWTGMLDLVEHGFVEKGIESRRLDGTMSLGARDKAVYEFNNDPNVQVMLMSLKAGNLGLNMVAACHVILLDLWWNPTTEDQAIDRAHRIGQTRPVTVTRITIKNTVEERILALQATKREIVASALGEDPGELSATRLTVEDLEFLFFGNN